MKLEEWKYHRKWTLANCCLGAFSFGLSLTIYYPTEFYYFRDTMKMKDPGTYYGLSWVFLCGSGIISSLVGSYYADLTKNLREIGLWSNAINVIGNIMYLLYYSPIVVLIGQFLIGTAAARMVAGVGEISRIYSQDEITGKVAFMGVFSTLGSLIGPCTTYVFNLVDTRIGSWVLNVNNTVGVVMGAFYFLQFWFNFFTLKNLSKEYNLKKEESDGFLLIQEGYNEKAWEEKEERKADVEKDELEKDPLVEKKETEESLLEEDIVSREDQIFGRAKSREEEEKEQALSRVASYVEELSFQDRYLLALRTLLRNKEVLFLYGLSFFCSYARATIILLSPIKAAFYLKWLPINLATFNIVSTFTGAVPTAVALSALAKYIEDLYLLGYTVITLQLSLIFIAVFPMVSDNYLMATVLMYASGILCLMSTAGFHIMSRSMLAKFVPENIQTVTEAIRNGLFELSYLIAGLCVKLPQTYMPEFMLTVAFLMTFTLSWLIVNAEKFKNIKVMEIEV